MIENKTKETVQNIEFQKENKIIDLQTYYSKLEQIAKKELSRQMQSYLPENNNYFVDKTVLSYEEIKKTYQEKLKNIKNFPNKYFQKKKLMKKYMPWIEINESKEKQNLKKDEKTELMIKFYKKTQNDNSKIESERSYKQQTILKYFPNIRKKTLQQKTDVGIGFLFKHLMNQSYNEYKKQNKNQS